MLIRAATDSKKCNVEDVIQDERCLNIERGNDDGSDVLIAEVSPHITYNWVPRHLHQNRAALSYSRALIAYNYHNSKYKSLLVRFSSRKKPLYTN